MKKLNMFATGVQLSYFRKDLFKITQEYLAEILDLSVSTIQSWEQGRRCPSLEHALALADVYGCRIDDLVIIDDDNDPDMKKAA